jgi:cell division transport system permease protein
VLRAIKYFFVEAGGSLWRRRSAAAVAVLTIAAGMFVLGFFLMLNANLQRLVGRWSESAELSVYLRDDATPEQLAVVDDLIAKSGLAARREYLSKEQAAVRFRQDFPDMADATAKLDANPFPASFEVRLKPEVREAGAAVDSLAMTLGSMPGVADVRYDRRWLSRLNAVVRFVRGIGLVIIAMLAVASALTVANVVRLAASARREEIDIMQLVGAPFAYVRGPFVVEGVLQGGTGALVAVLLLWAVFLAVRAKYGAMLADLLGGSSLAFLSAPLALVIVVGGMLLGCLGGFIVARQVR